MEILKREIIDIKERKFPKQICYRPIGIIHSPFKSLKGIPIQSSMSNSEGIIEIFPEFQPALKDLNNFSYIFCIYHFDLVKLPIPLQSKPFLDDNVRGVFAIRTPFRPNPIGVSIFELKKISNNKIYVKNIDVLDRTPILDIKPYIPQFDKRESAKVGWLKGKIKFKTS
ncbi:MAG: tRNA (N6-threonylcarbamoyladenosine(37)-N6)-methyltransferase TrmO [Promethearchaeota archaeon]